MPHPKSALQMRVFVGVYNLGIAYNLCTFVQNAAGRRSCFTFRNCAT